MITRHLVVELLNGLENFGLVIAINTARDVEVSLVVHLEFSPLAIDLFCNFAEQIFAFRWREHPNIRSRLQEVCTEPRSAEA